MKTTKDNHKALHSDQPAVKRLDQIQGVALKKPKTLIQYSTRINIPEQELSNEQIKIRRQSNKYIYGKTMKCNKCQKRQAISEFYFADKKNGRRKLFCRDCQMRYYDNVTEIGKTRFGLKILKKGFRRCPICKDILPLHKFRKSLKYYGDYFHICIICEKEYYISKHCKKNGIKRGDYDKSKFINKSQSHTKGKIKITDLKTKKIFIF